MARLALLVFGSLVSTSRCLEHRPLLTTRLATAHSRAPTPLLAAATLSASQGDAASSGASVPSTVANLAKNIVGSGVLALAAGVGAFSGASVAVLPALVMLCAMCALSAYTFSTIARVSAAVGADTYRDAWSRIFGKRSAAFPNAAIIFKTFVGSLAYAIILGDSAASMATLAGAKGLLAAPNAWIGIISAAVLLPLCLLRDLSSLSAGSVIGTCGTAYTALFMAIRCLDRSYAPGGARAELIAPAMRPAFAAAAGPLGGLNLKALVLVSMLATTFLAHYNAPKFYAELATPKRGSKLRSFNVAVAGGFALAAALCGSIMSAGFLTFGSASSGFILNNYATADALAVVARVGIFSSVTFSYPLLFFGLRDGVIGLLRLDGAKEGVHRVATVALLALVNSLACVMKDLGLVTALGGAILGSTIVYTLPALMALATSAKNKADGKAPLLGPLETAFNYALVPLGGALAVIGAAMTLKAA
mmetsp:Transcript_47544/g.153656  ORF Transcript_47544/g.153656 Transcript_47544/m.153656 type:complete len:477 (-) Transcript_47544:425-1855(-)